MIFKFNFAILERTETRTVLICTNEIENIMFLYERENLAGHLYSDVNIKYENDSWLSFEASKIIWAEINNNITPLDESDPKNLIFQINNLELESLNEFQITEETIEETGFLKKKNKTIRKILKQTQEDSEKNFIMTNKSFPESIIIKNNFEIQIIDENILNIFSELDNNFQYI